MSELLNNLTYLIVTYLLPLIFPGIGNSQPRAIYYWIINKPIVLLFVSIPFLFSIIYIFRRLIKNI